MDQSLNRKGKAGKLRLYRVTPRMAFTTVLVTATMQMLVSGTPAYAFEQSITPAPAPADGTGAESTGPVRHDLSDNATISNSSLPKGGSSATPKPGDNPPAIVEQHSLEDAIHGIVINQVITLVGQDFYNAFLTAWRDTPLADRYNVSIYERPSARWGSLIWVEYQHRRLFEAFLPPTRNRIRPIAERAAEQAYHNVVQADLDRLLFKDPDLANDEM